MKWTKQKLSKVFGLKQVKWHPTLDDWLRTPTNVSEAEKAFLAILRENCLERIDDFNARELILKVVGPTISCVNFDTEKFTAFAEREIFETLNGEALNFSPDILVASGTQEPEIPHFCLFVHTIFDTSGDPAGNCLAAMLAAAQQNPANTPIYGCYVLGRNWYFMILQLDKFCISNVYSFTQDDIFDIFGVLKRLKQQLLAS